MTKFILNLSKIAIDKSMDEQVNTDYSGTGSDEPGLQRQSS